jgi:hypothetical protein
VFATTFSSYSLAWRVPWVPRDGRQRTISAKRPPPETSQAPRQQPPMGRCGSSEGSAVASRRKPSEVRSDPGRLCNMQWAAVQGARFETSCNLQYQGCSVLHLAHVTEVWRSRGFWPGPAFSVPGSIESAGQVAVDRAFASRSKATSPNPIRCPPLRSTPGTPRAKGIAQTETRTKRKNT